MARYSRSVSFILKDATDEEPVISVIEIGKISNAIELKTQFRLFKYLLNHSLVACISEESL